MDRLDFLGAESTWSGSAVARRFRFLAHFPKLAEDDATALPAADWLLSVEAAADWLPSGSSSLWVS